MRNQPVRRRAGPVDVVRLRKERHLLVEPSRGQGSPDCGLAQGSDADLRCKLSLLFSIGIERNAPRYSHRVRKGISAGIDALTQIVTALYD